MTEKKLGHNVNVKAENLGYKVLKEYVKIAKSANHSGFRWEKVQKEVLPSF